MIESVFRSTILFCFFLCTNSLACTFAPGYELFRYSETKLIGTGETPGAPTVSVKSIERGFDDGDFASCSDAGVLTLVVANHETRNDTGYLFRLESGSLGSTAFLEEILAPIEIEEGQFGFRIVWLDWVKGQRGLAPVSAKLGVRAVSNTGVESEEIIVQIEHPGK